MRFLLIISFAIFSNYSYCSYADSTFSDKCYFSRDGKVALVSELDFVRFSKYSQRFPVFGLYHLGENRPNINIAISNDSVYFFNDSLDSDFLPIRIDSSFAKQYFLLKYKFALGENVTPFMSIEISERFLREENIYDFSQNVDVTDTIIPALKAFFFDYFLEFKYYNRIIFRDTLLNTYAVKKHLMEGLNEVEKKEIYKSDEELKGTDGYGTRIYSNADKTLFFIRAKYDVSSYIPITGESSYLWIDQTSKKERIVETYTTSFRMDDPIELRVLIKSGN